MIQTCFKAHRLRPPPLIPHMVRQKTSKLGKSLRWSSLSLEVARILKSGATERNGEIHGEYKLDPIDNVFLSSSRFVTLGMSALCLAVALGSAMPTGNLPAQAEDLGVSHEVIFISITLFVVGFGVGPLLFAPRK